MFHLMRLGLAFAAIAVFPSYARASGMYTITDLGTLPGTTQSIATGISSNGEVVGYSTNGPNGAPQAWVYNNGQMTPVTPIGGGIPNAINDSGQVVGGKFTSINDSGQYVGYQGGNAVLVSGSTTTLLGNFEPRVINNSGVIGGSLYIPSTGANDPAIYSNGQVTDLTKTLGLIGANGTVLAINNAGDAYVNYLTKQGVPEYFVLKANGQQFLATTDNGPYASINNSLQLVGGDLFQSGQFTRLTSVISPASQAYWQDGLQAIAINDVGQIVGTGELANGQQEAFLMTPVATPEPSTLAILGVGVACLAVRSVSRRLRRNAHN